MATPTPRKERQVTQGTARRHPTGIECRFPGHAVIARRAYELFLQRGGEHGRDWEDWLTAERELLPSGSGVIDRRPCSSVIGWKT